MGFFIEQALPLHPCSYIWSGSAAHSKVGQRGVTGWNSKNTSSLNTQKKRQNINEENCHKNDIQVRLFLNAFYWSRAKQVQAVLDSMDNLRCKASVCQLGGAARNPPQPSRLRTKHPNISQCGSTVTENNIQQCIKCDCVCAIIYRAI